MIEVRMRVVNGGNGFYGDQQKHRQANQRRALKIAHHDDGSMTIFLFNGDRVVRYADGTELMLYNDGTRATWRIPDGPDRG